MAFRFASLLLCLPSLCWTADIRRYCVPATMVDDSLPRFLRSVNIDSQAAALALHELAQKREIRVYGDNTGPEIQFVEEPLEPSDCLLLNWEERGELNVKIDQDSMRRKSRRPFHRKVDVSKWRRPQGDQALVPAILFRSRDASRHFGLISPESVLTLSLDRKHKETPVSRVTQFRPRHGDLVILYVACPPDRVGTCRLTIRNGRNWVTDRETGKRLEFPVLARSRAPSEEPETGRRISHAGDTPQGIYYLWGTLFTEDKAFGKLPRLDLDAAYPPLNAHPYEVNSYVLSEILPKEAWDDYWAHEWALAYKLGRLHLRIHANPEAEPKGEAATSRMAKEELSQTQGCLNAGKHMKPLLQALVSIGVLTKAQVERPEPLDSPTLGWRVSPRLGQAFVVVKDEDPKKTKPR